MTFHELPWERPACASSLLLRLLATSQMAQPAFPVIGWQATMMEVVTFGHAGTRQQLEGGVLFRQEWQSQ